MSLHERFTLTVERDGASSRVVALVITVHDTSGEATDIRCNGSKAGFVAGSVGDIARAAHIPARTWAGSRPITLVSETGAQIALLLRAVGPLRRVDRIDTVASAIAHMPREEASYWYAKSQQPRGLRALRVLLATDSHR